MDQRISYLQESVPSLPKCPEKKAIEKVAEEEAARARFEAEQEGEFVDVAAHISVCLISQKQGIEASDDEFGRLGITMKTFNDFNSI